jgi:hypothetical protein
MECIGYIASCGKLLSLTKETRGRHGVAGAYDAARGSLFCSLLKLLREVYSILQ